MIPGVTDKKRLPRLGKIRLGEKRQVEKNGRTVEYPSKLDHFSFRDVPEVEQIYGANCKEIFPVLLPANDEDTWFFTSRSAYRTSGLFCRCSDGETATRVRVPVAKDPRSGQMSGDDQGEAFIAENGLVVEPGAMYELPCAGDECPYSDGKFCKRVGRLFVMLPQVPRFGVYEITTSSFNSIVNVLNYARSIQGMTGGTLAGIPFALTLKPMKVQPNGKATTVYVLDLEFRGSLTQLAGMSRKIQVGGGALAGYLPPAQDVDPVPDDLYAHGGQALDAKLEGKPVPGSAADLNARLGARAEAEPEEDEGEERGGDASNGPGGFDPNRSDSGPDPEPELVQQQRPPQSRRTSRPDPRAVQAAQSAQAPVTAGAKAPASKASGNGGQSTNIF